MQVLFAEESEILFMTRSMTHHFTVFFMTFLTYVCVRFWDHPLKGLNCGCCSGETAFRTGVILPVQDPSSVVGGYSSPEHTLHVDKIVMPHGAELTFIIWHGLVSLSAGKHFAEDTMILKFSKSLPNELYVS